MKHSLNVVCDNRFLEDQTIHELFDSFGTEIAFELLDEFVGLLDNCIGSLQQARLSQDQASLTNIAHKLMGTARMYGAMELAKLSELSKERWQGASVPSVSDDVDQLTIMSMKTRLVCVAFISECQSYCGKAEKVEPKRIVQLLQSVQRAA